MSKLSPEQEALKADIAKSAGIWAIIIGAIIGGIAFALNDEFTQPLRGLIGGGVFVVVATLIFIWRKKANSAAATCGKCSATFSITRTGREEEVLSSVAKETREAQPDYSTKVTTWIEEEIRTTDTYACAKCGDTETKVSTRTSRRDEKESIEPAPEKGKSGGQGGFFSADIPEAPKAGGVTTSKSASGPKK